MRRRYIPRRHFRSCRTERRRRPARCRGTHKLRRYNRASCACRWHHRRSGACLRRPSICANCVVSGATSKRAATPNTSFRIKAVKHKTVVNKTAIILVHRFIVLFSLFAGRAAGMKLFFDLRTNDWFQCSKSGFGCQETTVKHKKSAEIIGGLCKISLDTRIQNHKIQARFWRKLGVNRRKMRRINRASRRRGCADRPSAGAGAPRRFRDARRRSAYRRSRCPSSRAAAGW